MTDENRKIWERISAYAEEVLKDIDPQKTQVSVQLDALRPVMEEIAKEKKQSLEDIFIRHGKFFTIIARTEQIFHDNRTGGQSSLISRL